jgi:serine/threonine-protein kinase
VVSPSRVYTLGKYRVVAELARGGMGIVYLALARGPGAFNKLLVLKELKREMRADPGVVSMFMEEARLAACLSHPNVVHTIEAGSDGERHYIAMEYLDGQSLHRVVSRARRMGNAAPFAWQTSVIARAIEGLAYAHSALDLDGKPLGIVHRDMSPHNVVVGYDGHVKVLDFGIAKATTSSVDTQSGLLKGKVAYMSPEQAAGAPVDKRADVFAVGVMLWEAATGRRFWAGMENDMQILRALLNGQVGTSRDRTMAEIPGQLQHVIAQATAPRPSQRYANATLLLADLRGALTSCGVPWLSAPEIGNFPAELFKEDRAKLQASIDEALDLCKRPDSGVYSMGGSSGSGERTAVETRPLPTLEPGVADATPSDAPILTSSGPTETYVSAIAPPIARTTIEPRPTGNPRLWGLLFAMAAGAVTAAVALLALQRSTPPARPAAAASQANAAVSFGSARAVDPASERIHLVVRATPPNARIVVDKQIVLDNPCVMTLPRDGASHSVRVEADGYTAREDRFDATGDMTLVIGLERHETVAAPVPMRASAPVAGAKGASAAPAGDATNPYAE